MPIPESEFTAMMRASASVRFEYLVKRVVDSECVWSLKSAGGWVLAGNQVGQELAPIWSSEVFATACATGPWADAKPVQISLTDWMEKWLPGLERDGRRVAVFPTPEDRGLVVDCQSLKTVLLDEMAKYEY